MGPLLCRCTFVRRAVYVLLCVFVLLIKQEIYTLPHLATRWNEPTKTNGFASWTDWPAAVWKMKKNGQTTVIG